MLDAIEFEDRSKEPKTSEPERPEWPEMLQEVVERTTKSDYANLIITTHHVAAALAKLAGFNEAPVFGKAPLPGIKLPPVRYDSLWVSLKSTIIGESKWSTYEAVLPPGVPTTTTSPAAPAAVGVDRRPKLLIALDHAKDAQTVPEVAALSARLVELGNRKASTINHFRSWLLTVGDSWRSERRVAVAGVIEAAAILGIDEVDDLMAAVLEDQNTQDFVASIAAQRLRLIRPRAAATRLRLWEALRRRIQDWETLPAHHRFAALALPSVSTVGGADVIDFISERVLHASGDLLTGAIGAILEGSRRPDFADEEMRLRISASVRRRLTDESVSSSTIGQLIWALGAVAGPTELDAVAGTLRSAFVSPRETEDAGAIRAGRLLVKRFGGVAFLAFARAFGSEGSGDYQRFLTILVTTA